MEIQSDKIFYNTQSKKKLKALRGKKWLELQKVMHAKGVFSKQEKLRLLQQIIWIDQEVERLALLEEAKE